MLTALAVACGGSNSDGGSGGNDAAEPSDAGTGGGDAGGDAGSPATCVFAPTGQFNPQVECRWDAPATGSLYPSLDDVVMTPVVANMTDDNDDGVVDVQDIPDIAFISYQLEDEDCPSGANCGCCNSSGVLRVVSGGCEGGVLTEHFTVGPAEIQADIGEADVWLDNSGGLALGDIDADGSIDIVATTRRGGTIAFERNGSVKWYQPEHPKGDDHLSATQPALADIDSDGMPEVIQGRVVLNGEDGSLQWRGSLGLGTNGFMGPMSALGDIDLSGGLNLLAGATSYD
ncbi:MAG: VCBS repeat-containing protein, partial [Myxococcota bacterium]